MATFGLVSLLAAPPAVALWAGINIDVHQDNLDVIANDFHVEGRIESGNPGGNWGNPPVLLEHVDDLFPDFSYSITPDPDSEGNWFFFTADWSGADYPYCSILHLGLLFDVEGANVVVDLVGWWTLDGERIDTGQNLGFFPVPGFDVSDEAQTLRLQNGIVDGIINPGEIPIEIVNLDVVPIADQAQLEALLGPNPFLELTRTGLQQTLPWINGVNAGGVINAANPQSFPPDSFFDVFFELDAPPTPGSVAVETPFTVPEGGFLISRQLLRFENNNGVTENRWLWEIHGADDNIRGCCMPDGSCIMMPPEECPLAGGYIPAGGFCQGDNNGNNIDDACESQGEECPLEEDDTLRICEPLQALQCADGQIDEFCMPLVVFMNQGMPMAELCDCLIPGDCGPVKVKPIGTAMEYEFSCEGACPDPLECLVHVAGISTGQPTISSTQVADGDQITCQCAEQEPEVCPLPPTLPAICAPRQAMDCTKGGPDDLCLPLVAYVDGNGQPQAELCDCISGDDCGPVTVTQVTAAEYEFSCDGICPDPLECLIHLGGVSTGAPSIRSSQVTAGEAISCECAEAPVDYCPLPDDPHPMCAHLQATDCIYNGPEDLVCLPQVVNVDPANVMPVAEVCDCYHEADDCGPVKVVEVIPNREWDLICDGVCPAPEECLVHVNGTSMGVHQVSSTQVSGNVTCECAQLPPDEACCLPDGSCVMIPQPDCLAQGGFLAPGGVCLGDNDGDGVDDACEDEDQACCLTDGSGQCIMTTAADCVAQGGFFPPGGVCLGDNDGDGVDDACEDEEQACCLTDGTGQCIMTTAADCLALGGFFPPGGVCLGDNDGNGVDDACETPDYYFEFSLDIGSDTELSDPNRDGDEHFDPGDIYWWKGPYIPNPVNGFKDDGLIWRDFSGTGTGLYDPWPIPGIPLTAVPVGNPAYTPESYHEWFDLDGHDQVQFSLLEIIPVGTIIQHPIPAYDDACIYEPEFLMISYDDDMAPGWPGGMGIWDVPVTAPSPAGMIYGNNPDEIIGVTVALAMPPVPIISIYPIADEIGVHPNMAPNPMTDEEDDDVDSLDVVKNQDLASCSVLLFSPDHEATFMDFAGWALDPGGIYERTAGGPVQIIDEFIHLGISEEADVDAFELTTMENPDEPGVLYLAIIFSVDEDDPLTPNTDESGGLNPNALYYSFLTGYSMLFTDLEDDVDAVTIWTKSMEQLPPCAVTDVNCDGSVNFLDIAEITSPLNWGKPVSMAANPCSDADGNGSINFLDVAMVTSPGHWGTSTGPCQCPAGCP